MVGNNRIEAVDESSVTYRVTPSGSWQGWRYVLAKQAQPEPIEKPRVRCRHCGGEMQLVAVTDGRGRLLYNHPLPYLDSG